LGLTGFVVVVVVVVVAPMHYGILFSAQVGCPQEKGKV